jgi:LPS sulfotransferase NodH
MKRLLQSFAAPQRETKAPSIQVKSPQLDFGDLQRTFVLYSNFRSGSHMFKSAVQSLAGVTGPDEPFNMSLSGGDWFTFRDFKEAKHLGDAKPYRNDTSEFYDYLAGFYEKCPLTGPVLFDLKYSQSYTLGMSERLMVPVLLQELINLKLPIVHLVRRDVVAQAISLLVAEQTGEFFSTKGPESQAKPKIWLNPKDVHQIATSQMFAIKSATRNLEVLGANMLSIFYEDLVSANKQEHYQRTFRFLDHYAEVPSDFDPSTVRQNSMRRVANIGEVLQYISEEDPILPVSNRF